MTNALNLQAPLDTLAMVFAEDVILSQSRIKGLPWMVRLQDKIRLFHPFHAYKLVYAGVRGVTRWTLLETIRAYGLETLTESRESDDAQRRHAAFFRGPGCAGRATFRL